MKTSKKGTPMSAQGISLVHDKSRVTIMKRFISAVFSVVLIALLSASTLVAFAQGSVSDAGSVLTPTEALALEEKLDVLSKKYNVDIAFATTKALYNPEGIDASANDYYDDNGYGFGENKDGILLYLSTKSREYCFITNGYGDYAVNSRGLDYLDSKVIPFLKADDYAGATNAFAETCDELLQMANDGKPYNKKDTKTVITTYVVAIGIALIVAFSMTNNKLKQMKTAVKNDDANNYMKPGSLNISYSQDIFLFSNVSKTAKPKNTSSSSSSSGGGRGSKSGKY